RCTRSCRFCAVRKPKIRPAPPDKKEPYKILQAVKELGIKFVIITSVTRDDLRDSGAGQFARTIRIIRNYKKDIRVEVLIPDLLGSYLKQVVKECPDVLAHNLETVPRLYRRIRKESRYSRSLEVLAESKIINPKLITKSSLLLGMSEREKEVIEVMHDLAGVGCDILVLGQYLAPSLRHYPVKEYITAKQFERYKNIGLQMGFKAVLASPLARTSYKAYEVYNSVQCIPRILNKN
ncbi:MAG: lipoyl synthase, partial [Candidatus Omnitrophica bacterium]|nr:lipoyl synthase [Candidatus Omnitrophota bacterium]